MAIEVAAPVAEFLSFDRTTAGVKATGAITVLTGGTDTDTLAISDSKKVLTFEMLADPTAPSNASYRPVAVQTTTWELQDLIVAAINAGLDIVATENNTGAEATVTFSTAAPSDGAIVTVTDALGNAVAFEFVTAGGPLTGDVAVIKGATHLTAATAFEAAVNTAFEDLGGAGVDTIVAVDVSGTVTLTGNAAYGKETQVAADPVETVADANIACAVWGNSTLADGATAIALTATYKGTSGNETIAEVGNTFSVSGMSSGTNAALTVGLNDTVGTPEFTMTRYDTGRIRYTDADGNVQDVHSDNPMVRNLFDAIKAIVAA